MLKIHVHLYNGYQNLMNSRLELHDLTRFSSCVKESGIPYVSANLTLFDVMNKYMQRSYILNLIKREFAIVPKFLL